MYTLSEISRTSCNLCVMIIIDLPSFFIERITLKRLLLSCGVRTAVGSSSIRILAPFIIAFIISTVCFSETDISHIFLSGFTVNPYFFATSVILLRISALFLYSLSERAISIFSTASIEETNLKC